ncbi:MAG: DUF4407 domain-containing protein [Streptosporangiaceae bacterium]
MTDPNVVAQQKALAPARAHDFLPWLGGANRAILDQVPQERARFVQMALILLTTSSIAMVSMIFAMNDGVKVPLPVAVVIGLCWGFIILNLDRFLVLSMGATRAGWRLFLMAIPRLLLATVISIVIATPLTLRVFQHDINVQIAKAQAADSKQLKSMIAQSGPAQEASQVQSKITTDEQVLAGHLPVTVTNPQLQDAQSQVNQLQPKVAQAQQNVIKTRAAYQCEVDGSGPGCAGASKRAGYGPIAQAKQAQYQQAVSGYNSLTSQLASAQKNLKTAEQSVGQAQGRTLAQDQKMARQELPGLRAQYVKLEAEVQKSNNSAQQAINNDSGILAQLSGLAAAGANNPVLGFAQFIVTALFFLIEILPVMVKFLLNMGQMTTYETVAKIEDEKIVDQVRQTRITARREAVRKSDEEIKKKDSDSQKRINIATDMDQREQNLGIRANEHVAKEMEGILDVALREWSTRVRASLTGSPGTADGPSPAGTAGGTHPAGYSNGNQYGAIQNGSIPAAVGMAGGAAGRSTGSVGNGSEHTAPTVPPAWMPPTRPGFGLPKDDDLL